MNQAQIAKIIASFQALGRQIQVGEAFKFPKLTVSQPLIWMGMGGSALGAQLWQSYSQLQSPQPLIIWQQPKRPGFLNPQSIIFISSYSGQTTETLQFYCQLSHRRARIFGLTGGGQLEKYFHRDKVPFFKIPAELNPSGQPRHGIGFGLGFLSGFYQQQQILANGLLGQWRRSLSDFSNFRPSANDESLAELAQFINRQNTIIVIAAAAFSGLGQFWQNQLQETGKKLAIFAADTALRHHLPEALAANKKMAVVFLKTNESEFNPLINWLQQQGIPYRETIFPKGSDAKQLLWGINLGQYLALAIAQLDHRDANEIAAIDWLKRQ